MAVRHILQLGEPRLRERGRAVRADELGTAWLGDLIGDLVDTMRAADGKGIAAPQIGVPVRVFVVEVRESATQYYRHSVDLRVIVNPTLHSRTEATFESYEGCLSIPGLRGLVPRFADIEIRYVDADGLPIEERVWGMPAATFQHELDHLDGRLYLDRVTDLRTLSSYTEFKRHHEEPWLARVADAIVDAGICRTTISASARRS